MRISDKALDDLVIPSEGLKLYAYPDPGSRDGKPWTIGYGHTKGVSSRDECSIKQAKIWLMEDIKEAEKGVTRNVKVELTQNQFDALVDFVYNLGTTRFKSSTLLKKLNARDYEGAAKEFKRWIYNDGRVMAGLVKRRKREKEWFES